MYNVEEKVIKILQKMTTTELAVLL